MARSLRILVVTDHPARIDPHADARLAGGGTTGDIGLGLKLPAFASVAAVSPAGAGAGAGAGGSDRALRDRGRQRRVRRCALCHAPR